MRVIALALLVAAAVGCDEKKEEPKPAPAATAPAPAPAPAAAPADPAAAAAAPSAAAAAPAPGSPNTPSPAAAMVAAAAAGEGKGGPPCEQAYNSIEAMIKSMEKSMPAGGKTTGGGLPPKDKFIAGCKELPEMMQNCMVMSYGMTHQKECMEAKSKLDPATAAKVKAMMGK